MMRRIREITISIRLLIPLMILVVVTPLSDVAKAGAAPQQGKTAPRGTGANRSKKVREFFNAARAGDTKKVLQLLDAGVNVNASFQRDESELSGKTALMIASSRGYSDLVEKLISRGADVNRKHYSGQTALMFAAHGGDVSTIKALLRAGADPNTKVVAFHAGELTPLTITINTRHEQRFEVANILLAAKAEVNFKGRFLMSPLMHALEDLEMVKLLIAHGADVNQRNFRGATALMGAACGRDVSVVKYLIEKGADVNARDSDGTTALMCADDERRMFDRQERDEIIQVLKRAQAGSKP